MAPERQLERHSKFAQSSGVLGQGLFALALGLLSWSLNNLNILRAHIQTPAGTHPSWTPREIDVAQHLTWVNAMRNAWVIPDYHMPAATTPAIFCPLMALLGQLTKVGIDASAAYAVAQLAVGIVAVYCILVSLRLFLVSRWQAMAAVVLVFASVPLTSLLNVWRALRGQDFALPIFFVSDGLFSIGPLSIVFGAASVYASLILLTRYLLIGRRRYLFLTAAFAAVAGLCHPFEVFTIMAATTLTLIVLRWPNLRGALAESLIVIVPAGLSVLPYVYFSLTVPWMRQMTAQNIYRLPDLLRLLGILGIPAAFVLANLVIGPRLRATSDVVLQCWFAATLMVMHIPKLPFALHAADGLGLITALLAVRQISQLPRLRSWVALRPRMARLAATVVLVPAIVVHAGVRYKMFRDSIKHESPLGASAVSTQAEYDLVRWFARNASGGDLVIAPGNETSWMLATAPVHTIASHWLFSGTYGHQLMLRDSFYRGDWTDETARDFLRKYGINYVVATEGSPVHRVLSAYPKAALFPPFTLYHLPENHMQDHLPDP
jgi:hypothetical protein